MVKVIEENKVVRDWALNNNVPVNKFGRVPRKVRRMYNSYVKKNSSRESKFITPSFHAGLGFGEQPNLMNNEQNTNKEKKMSYTPKNAVLPKVVEYLEKHTGVICYVTDMETALNLNKRQIQNAVYRAAGEKQLPIETKISGHAWVFMPRPTKPVVPEVVKPSRRVFEELTITRSGNVLVQDEYGVVYSLKELE